MLSNIDFIEREFALKGEISSALIENTVLEIVVSVLRLSGLKEKNAEYYNEENSVLVLAKQYIKDNIERAQDVGEIAEYCRLSVKQLTRIFKKHTSVSPGEYIKKSVLNM